MARSLPVLSLRQAIDEYVIALSVLSLRRTAVCTMVRDQPKLLFVLWTGVNSFTQSEQVFGVFFLFKTHNELWFQQMSKNR
jgi:hypothetical protein